MSIKVVKIRQGSSDIQSIALLPGMKVIFSNNDNITETDVGIYPVINISGNETFSAKVLDHLWLDEKRCIEIYSHDNKRNIYMGKAITSMTLKPNSQLEHISRIFRGVVISIGESVNNAEFDEMSSKLLRDKLISYFNKNNYPISVDYERIGSDSKHFTQILESHLSSSYDFIFTTGSIGLSYQDFAYNVVNKFIDYEIPGIMDLIRFKTGLQNPLSAINRSIAGVKDRKLVFCLPNNIRAVIEYFSEIEKILLQTIYMVHGIDIP